MKATTILAVVSVLTACLLRSSEAVTCTADATVAGCIDCTTSPTDAECVAEAAAATTTTTTVATPTTTTTSATATTTAASSPSNSSGRRKIVRITNLRYPNVTRIRVNRNRLWSTTVRNGRRDIRRVREARTYMRIFMRKT
ncbi:GD15101 [Drosophila simulans]|uniref:GD15101 n=1 Tax=Drosophila simulans TaxID=7240 RepID=B4NTB8_DROSI|nr:GD15101 [Drosophila simulans]